VQKISNIKKWGSELFSQGKGSLIFKKWLYLEPQIEIDWCKSNKERYGFLINLIYGRFKTLDISLSYGEIVDMCALFILRNSFEKVKFLEKADSIDNDTLKGILPGNCWPYLKERGFKV
jgi:hypothetical protein